MLASNNLASLFIPFLLEKLGAAQKETKLETIDLLTKMVEQFSFVTLSSELSLILSTISNVYFNVVEDQIQGTASVAIGKTLSKLIDTTASGLASD